MCLERGFIRPGFVGEESSFLLSIFQEDIALASRLGPELGHGGLQ